MVIQPAACRVAVAISGSSMVPAGILSRAPSALAAKDTASVLASSMASTDGNQMISGAGPPPAWKARAATSDAAEATQTTRRYCMKATSRTSPPWASAISIIAEAAPADVPQIAVVPGSVPPLAIR